MITTNTSNAVITAEGENPFDGVSPDPTAFGDGLNNVFVLILGGVWGLALIIIGILAVIQLVKWGAARQDSRSEDMTEAAAGFKTNLLVFACTAGVGIIFGAILLVVNQA